MTVDPRTPVIIGVAPVAQRLDELDHLTDAVDAIELMGRALVAGAADTGAHVPDVLEAIDTIGVVGGLWRHRDPARLVADALGIDDVHTILTSFGGNTPIRFAHDLADRIRVGAVEVAVVLGGECNLSRWALRAEGLEPTRRDEPDADADEFWGPGLDMGDEVARARGGEHPRNTYAVQESALRARRRESHDECRRRAAGLWAGYARAAVANPVAADRRGVDADAIMTPSPGNRMVSWPYTKAMCANNTVDQAGAVIIASTAAADRLGVPADRRVYPHLCVASADTPAPTARAGYPDAPGLVAGARAVVDAAGGPEALTHVELYACFPSVVQMTADAMGLPTDRPLSVTGGLGFAGAPLNFSAGMGLIGMVPVLRADPGALGLVQGNGGHISKHAFGLYATRPPATAHHVVDLGQVGPEATPADPDRAGEATIDGITVEYDREGPQRAVAIVRFADGARTWATSVDPVVMEAAVVREPVGTRVRVEAGVLALADGPAGTSGPAG